MDGVGNNGDGWLWRRRVAVGGGSGGRGWQWCRNGEEIGSRLVVVRLGRGNVQFYPFFRPNVQISNGIQVRVDIETVRKWKYLFVQIKR